MKPIEFSKRQALFRKLIRGIVLETGLSETLAAPYASAALRVLDEEKGANGQLYVPAAPQSHDVLQIAAALERGESIDQVCRMHHLSRRTLHRLFPGGIPASRQP